MENIVEEFPIGGFREEGTREGKRWKSIKVSESTYKQIKMLSGMLGLKVSRVVNLSILILYLLTVNKIVLPKEKADEAKLTECVFREVPSESIVELNPLCILNKLVARFYARKSFYETLIKNIESLTG